MIDYPYLADQAFLKFIDNLMVLEYYVKITSLNRFDIPIASLEGVATGGNVNFNGNSAIRRTGNVTLLADALRYKLTDIESIIAINKRISLEVGIKNPTSSYADYPILWFPLGIYIISQPSIVYNVQNYTISLSLKDKMVLLNGEVGGTISAATTFSPIKVEGKDQPQPVKYYDLIYSLVVLRGGIPADKVIIDNIDNYLKQVVQYNGTKWALVKPTAKGSTYYTFSEVDEVAEEDKVNAYEQNENIGYEVMDFTYPTDSTLACNPGDSIVTVLDKIKNTLGNYEYFFDIEGIFHFQQIKNYINEGSKKIELSEAINDKYLQNVESNSKSVYNFTDANLITAFQNTPIYNNIKNNIVIWGDTAEGSLDAYYFQVAIDTPPSLPDGEKIWYVTLAENEQGYKYATKASTTEFPDSKSIVVKEWRTELYLQAIENINNVTYYSEKLLKEWPKVYDIEEGKYRTGVAEKENKTPTHKLTYFFDMINPEKVPQVSDISISNLGLRTKTIVDNNIDCLFFPYPPDVCFIKTGQGEETAKWREVCLQQGWNYTQVYPKLFDTLKIGDMYNAAYDLARAMLHEVINYSENITITALPIYHLEPNMRITVKHTESQIDGDYLIQSISLPLAGFQGTMTLNCAKVFEKI